LLESAIDVSQIFLREGIIVIEERRGVIQEEYQANNPEAYTDLPMIAVVDSTTASAAEVVAAALQANGRALLIGTQTFGKGSVQAIVELSDGSSLRITTSRWLTPNGDVLDMKGLEPDQVIDPDLASSEQVLIDAARILIEGLDQE
jgi:carboxyl-terminal processing protease